MYEFEFLKASTVEEALEALQEEDAQLLGGGQTLIPTLRQRLAAPSTLISISSIPELKGIAVEDNRLRIGAAATHAAVCALGDKFPALSALAGHIGDPAVQHRGTIGGSVANNDPSADYPAAVLAAGVEVETTMRRLAPGSFFVGLFETALEPGEIVKSVVFEVTPRAAYVKIEQPASRFALVGAFAAWHGDELRLAITGASQNGVYRWHDAESVLMADAAADLSAIEIDQDDMISDIHADAAFRAHLVRVASRRAVAASLLPGGTDA